MRKISFLAGKRIALLIALVVLISLMLYCFFPSRLSIPLNRINDGAPTAAAIVSKGTETELSGGYAAVAENKRFRLDVNGQDTLFQIVDKTSGIIWNSGYPVDKTQKITRRNQRVMTTLIDVDYIDENGEEATVNNTVSGVSVRYTLLQNGIQMKFSFEDQKIEVGMQLCLNDSGFYVRIPKTLLKESGKCRLVSLDILPSFGSIFSGSNGFMVYPDGCGALYECGVSKSDTGLYTRSVYAEQYEDPGQSVKDRTNGAAPVDMPYFGSAVRGRSGFIAYVREGAENARVSLSGGTKTLALSRIYSTAVYRYSLEIKNSQDKPAETFSSKRENLDYGIQYCLLDAEETNYSQMAVTLRGYLMDSGLLKKNAAVGEKVPLTLQWLMTVKQNSLFGSNVLTMTTFRQVSERLNELEKAGVSDTCSLLLGWQKEGAGSYPLSTTVSRAAGGTSALKGLLKTQNSSRSFFLTTDYVQAQKDGGVNVRRDVVYNFLHSAVTDSDQSMFLLNPLRQYNLFAMKDLKAYTSLHARGLAFDSMSDYLPSDASSGRAVTASDTKKIYGAFVKTAADGGATVAVQGGADYLLRGSSYIYDLAQMSSGSPQFDEDIPFCQMLLHGLYIYSGTIPGNMSSDYTRMKLKWVEYGCAPYFLLSEQSSSMLRDAVITDVFNSRFTDWKTDMVDTMQEFQRKLSVLQDKMMLSHERLSDTLVKVTYQGGYVVLVNYSDTAADTSYGSVPAKDYLVLQERGS